MNEIYEKFIEILSSEDTEQINKFLEEHFDELPQDLQEKIIFALFEDAAEKNLAGHEALLEFEQDGLETLKKLQQALASYQEAQQIVTNAQTSGAKGWKSNEQGKKNRYWLVENALQEMFNPLRECLYEYHRLGLDQMYTKSVEARQAIHKAMDKLSAIASARPNSINITNYAYCKMVELKNLYAVATQEEKTQIVTVLKKLDPTNSSKYEEILN